MNDKSVSIIHQPFGNGQPYFQQPFERFPRMPKPEEPIMIGCSTIPHHMAETMHVEYCVNDGRINLIDAMCIGESDCIGNDPGQRWWIASLPPCPIKTTLRYRFKACTGLEDVYSQWFSCNLGNIETLDRLTGWANLGPDGIILNSNDISIQFLNRPDRLGVSIWRGFASPIPPVNGTSWTVTEDDGHMCLKGYCEVTIDTTNLTWVVRKGVKELIRTVKPIEIVTTYDETDRALDYITLTSYSPDEETYMGFGEHYNAVNQRGNIVYNRVFEQYKDQRLKTYVPMPFFITNNQWGMQVHTERLVEFDMASRDPSVWSMRIESSKNETVCFDILFGTPKEIRSAFIADDPPCPVVPEWALGPWMSSNDWNSQRLVEKMVAKTLELGIPATVLVIEAWSDETTFYIFNDATYIPKDDAPKLSDFNFRTDGLWPDPKAMVQRLKDQGIRTVLWQIPVLRDITDSTNEQHAIDRNHATEHSLVLKTIDGTSYRSKPGWFKNSLIPDFSKEETRQWWVAKRRYLLEEIGIAGFKTDGGEHLWGYEIMSGDGRMGDRLINAFPQMYLKTYHDELERVLGNGKGILFSRSGYVGSGSIPAHWAGDQDSTWEAFSSMIKAMLTASVSGIVWYSWDIGGFSGPIPTAELYLRSAAAATFSPIMQYHSEHNARKIPSRDRTPWNIGEQTHDERVVPIFKKFASIRMALIPYIAKQAERAIALREPLIRPLWFDWPDDCETLNIWDEYLLGTDLLIAPVMVENRSDREVYLPQGTWRMLGTNDMVYGPSVITVTAFLDQIPVFLRADIDVDPIFSDKPFSALVTAT